MPRFAPERWKPRDDSSEGYKTVDPNCVVLYQPQAEGRFACPCGCGEAPLSDKAVFAMGHDARLRGILIRAHLMDVPIRYVRAGDVVLPPISAYDVADRHVWKSYLDSATLRRDGANRTVLRRSLDRDDVVERGRWDYTGGQVAVVYRTKNDDIYELEYVNRAGDIKRLRVPATPLAEVEV